MPVSGAPEPTIGRVGRFLSICRGRSPDSAVTVAHVQGVSQQSRRCSVASLAIAAGVLVVFAAAAADAKPRLESTRVQFGVVARVQGAGCAPAAFSTATRAIEPLTLIPSVGDYVGDFEDIIVTNAGIGAGRVEWTMQPTQDECDLYADDPSWSWASEERSWGLTYRERAYVIRSSAHNGIRSIAGFRVNGRTRKSAPTIRKARRRLGRPSSLRRNDVSCRAKWERLALTIYFVNFGLGNPCRVGFAQWRRVHASGEPARWTAVVGRDPGVAADTTEEFLEYEMIGEPSDRAGYWTLADVWIPYGDAGYYPSLSARLSAGGRVRGFEFWIGAGGD
jgi:hypothetical protein